MGAGSIFIDQMGYEVGVPHIPTRVISLVPSQTELLYHLGLQDSIVGITKFCIHPDDGVKGKTKVGGTKHFNFDIIESLNPDLIIGNKEENYQEGIEQLKRQYPVWMSDIDSLGSSLDMIQQIGAIFGKEDRANILADSIRVNFNLLPKFKSLSALYFIWNNPKMVAGSGTFINEIMNLGGFENMISVDRYPILNDDDLKCLSPEVILLSSEPFPFAEKHIEQFEEIFPKSQILIVDGEMFSWYGSRLLSTPDYLIQLRERLIPTFSKSSQ
ncbi:ABC transporter substrate-binding protein [Fulvivirga lutimaris]|uniref:ABC transporter substrate-binding protein n=1 Tax=Fulvivirga lutimaris TaxID=1819566 RepID=UPI0012BC422F|nr:helical backbone metal receptor [Fulvivirga lutimaris]MTI41469.1 cobalamin-binding protein [Fulvivirga lutimaris]